MSDIFVICDKNKTYVPLANLGVGHFNYNNYNKDRNYRFTGPFIGHNLYTNSLRIVSKNDVPADYQEWNLSEDIIPKPENAEFREFFSDSDRPFGVFAQVFNTDQVIQFAIYEYTKTDPFLVGSISFEGIANWHFPYSYYPLQFTEKKQAEQFGLLLVNLYTWAKELANT